MASILNYGTFTRPHVDANLPRTNTEEELEARLKRLWNFSADGHKDGQNTTFIPCRTGGQSRPFLVSKQNQENISIRSISSQMFNRPVYVKLTVDHNGEASSQITKPTPFEESTEGRFSDPYSLHVNLKEKAPGDGMVFSPALHIRTELNKSLQSRICVTEVLAKQSRAPIRINNLSRKGTEQRMSFSSRNPQYAFYQDCKLLQKIFADPNSQKIFETLKEVVLNDLEIVVKKHHEAIRTNPEALEALMTAVNAFISKD